MLKSELFEDTLARGIVRLNARLDAVRIEFVKSIGNKQLRRLACVAVAPVIRQDVVSNVGSVSTHVMEVRHGPANDRVLGMDRTERARVLGAVSLVDLFTCL